MDLPKAAKFCVLIFVTVTVSIFAVVFVIALPGIFNCTSGIFKATPSTFSSSPSRSFQHVYQMRHESFSSFLRKTHLSTIQAYRGFASRFLQGEMAMITYTMKVVAKALHMHDRNKSSWASSSGFISNTTMGDMDQVSSPSSSATTEMKKQELKRTIATTLNPRSETGFGIQAVSRKHSRRIAKTWKHLSDHTSRSADIAAIHPKNVPSLPYPPEKSIAEPLGDKAAAEGALLEYEDKEPHVGMVLEVLPSSTEDNLVGSVYYELTERVHDELGLVDVHALDYAYRPVISSKERQLLFSAGATLKADIQQEHDWRTSSSLALHAGPVAYQVTYPTATLESGAVARPPTDPWIDIVRNHVSPGTGGRSERGRREAFYEKMGDRAFAGGSHGEIWRARRRCDIFASSEDSHRRQQQQPPCDDRQELIMKRLKVENGAACLEAGLREVYFGELLSREAQSPYLFTIYVDHFFRSAAAGSAAPSQWSKSSELWIVFENAGPSLRSYLYTPVTSGGFVMYQHSEFWLGLRRAFANKTMGRRVPASKALSLTQTNREESSSVSTFWRSERENEIRGGGSLRNETKAEGRALMKMFLKQLLSSAAFLHEHGIVHRDIKPSNIMCKTADEYPFLHRALTHLPPQNVRCVLGDFSSAYDEVTAGSMYTNGPSAAEQTDEYAPPEVLFGMEWIPFDKQNPYSYDSWSIGVVALELLLGTPNVFSIDQRTTTILSNRLKKSGATEADIQKALYLAALSQFCIYVPTAEEPGRKGWPLRDGDPLATAFIVKPTCTMHDFHSALRARDPLGTGFDSSTDPLLELVLALLSWNPSDRLTPAEALHHRYFTQLEGSPYRSTSASVVQTTPQPSNTFESSVVSKDPFLPIEYTCPKCGKKFDDYNSCHIHANSRRHARFCSYDQSVLPPCLSSHSMLPAHPTSGYCDIQGRRPSIEDFHSIHLPPTHQFYGVFDGHYGNLASKFVASRMHDELSKRLADLDERIRGGGVECRTETVTERCTAEKDWRAVVKKEVSESFHDLHEQILRVVSESPGGVMYESGTTATTLYITDEAVVVANVGDSRAILSRGASYNLSAEGGRGRGRGRGKSTSSKVATAMPLTVDHTPAEPAERERIISLGGFVASAGGIDRANGTLAVSRSIGDATLSPILSRTPHVVAMTRAEMRYICRTDVEEGGMVEFGTLPEEKIPCFIVLASDGLWDVMSNQDVIDLVIHVLRHSNSDIRREDGGAFQEAAQRLTHEAYIRGSMDNIGVCVVAIV